MPDEKPSTVKAPVLLKKREQIRSNNKQLFLWVAGGSIVVSFSLVISVFLVKQLIFNEKVLTEKGISSKNLATNIVNAKQLDENVNELRSNPSLKSARSNPEENNLDVIIDALPYDGNTVDLGASLQDVIVSGVSVDSLGVLGSDSVDAALDDGTSVVTEAIGSSQPSKFSFGISGTPDEIKGFIDRLNRSIRPIKITQMQLQPAGEGKITVTATAETYYQPSTVFELKEKVVKP